VEEKGRENEEMGGKERKGTGNAMKTGGSTTTGRERLKMERQEGSVPCLAPSSQSPRSVSSHNPLHIIIKIKICLCVIRVLYFVS